MTVLDGLGTSMKMEDEITRVTTENNPNSASPQVDKVDNAVDEELKINKLSSNSSIPDSNNNNSIKSLGCFCYLLLSTKIIVFTLIYFTTFHLRT
jgi:hypothetical protein